MKKYGTRYGVLAEVLKRAKKWQRLKKGGYVEVTELTFEEAQKAARFPGERKFFKQYTWNSKHIIYKVEFFGPEN